ncbi:MAG: preQ(1) synthase [Thermoplasmatota archaeon]
MKDKSDSDIEEIKGEEGPCSEDIDIIENEYSDKEYKIKISSPEFTCLCPGKRDQPDFAKIVITYIPKNYLLELKSLKLYYVSYRNIEIFHEEATNKILDDLVEAVKPRYMKVRGDWNIRGGIKTIVETEYVDDDWEGDQEGVEIKSVENAL